MRALYIAEFDPCCVGMSWRRWLAPHGIDLKIAIREPYWADSNGADWIERHSRSVGTDGLRAWAADLDLLITCPAIGQPWSWRSEAARLSGDIDEDTICGLRVADIKTRRRVALFHGSRTAGANAEVYAAHWRAKGWALAATTLDYRARMDAVYTPPVIDVLNLSPAQLRGQEPLRIVQATTDPSNTHTAEFQSVCRDLFVAGSVVVGLPHEAALRTKATFHAGFDHLRGAFSVNSVENSALGLVNLVHVRSEYRSWLHREWGVDLPWPEIATVDDLRSMIKALGNSFQLTRDYQAAGREWYLSQWHPKAISARVAEALKELAK